MDKTMPVRCMRCSDIYDHKDSNIDGESTGVCAHCYKIYMAELEEQQRREKEEHA